MKTSISKPGKANAKTLNDDVVGELQEESNGDGGALPLKHRHGTAAAAIEKEQ